MRRSTKRRAYTTEIVSQSSDESAVIVRLNTPAQRFFLGDRVRMSTGLQEFNVIGVDFCQANGRYLVHGKLGPCHFFRWQEDVEHVARTR